MMHQIKKHGDVLLMAMALAVLAGAIIRMTLKKVIPSAPGIVFTQWWQDDMGRAFLEDLVNEFESLHDGIKKIFPEIGIIGRF